MPKFLITRCTTYDMAGMSMINGARNGLGQIYPDAEFGALVFQQDHKDQDGLKQFIDTTDRAEALYWADCCIDLGGLCKGFDPYRKEYIGMCRTRDIPYIYMAVSFEHPEPEIVKDVPATARGPHAAEEYFKSAWKKPDIAPDISFLIEPEPSWLGNDCICYTTHKGKPWHKYLEECMGCEDPQKMLQVIFKPDDQFTCWEPTLGVQAVHASPEELYGTIANAFHVKTCRYHAAVAAIMGGVPYDIPFGMPNADKYKDLETWKYKGLEQIRKEAMVSCELVKEVLHG